MTKAGFIKGFEALRGTYILRMQAMSEKTIDWKRDTDADLYGDKRKSKGEIIKIISATDCGILGFQLGSTFGSTSVVR